MCAEYAAHPFTQGGRDTVIVILSGLICHSELAEESQRDVSAALNVTVRDVSAALNVTVRDVSATLNVTVRDVSATLNVTVRDVSAALNVTVRDVSAALNVTGGTSLYSREAGGEQEKQWNITILS